MRRILGPAALLFFIAAVAIATGAEDKFDADKLVGDWTPIDGAKAGDKVEKDRLKMKVKASKETFTLETDMGKFVIGYKLDTKASPVTVDMEIKEGPVPEGKAKGIIAVSGDDMKLCYVFMPDDKRPTKFESTKDNNAYFWTFKRAGK
jgi:uncharacterized protein (TIGR03067 family)